MCMNLPIYVEPCTIELSILSSLKKCYDFICIQGWFQNNPTANNNDVGPNQTMLTKVFFNGATLQQVASSCTVSPLQTP
jgi:hypothetical protein